MYRYMGNPQILFPKKIKNRLDLKKIIIKYNKETADKINDA